jgi:hypothetical protein
MMRHLSVGVGFSYADFGETVETTGQAAKNVYAFVSIFFETFKQFSGRPFHLAGESYGVRDHSVAVLGLCIAYQLPGSLFACLR